MNGRINYVDFAPQRLEKSFWKGPTYENLDACLEHANQWMRDNYNREIINVETVVMPNLD